MAIALWIIGIVAANTNCTGLELSIGLWLSGHRNGLIKLAARVEASLCGAGELRAQEAHVVSANLVSQATRTRQSREDVARGSRR